MLAYCSHDLVCPSHSDGPPSAHLDLLLNPLIILVGSKVREARERATELKPISEGLWAGPWQKRKPMERSQSSARPAGQRNAHPFS